MNEHNQRVIIITAISLIIIFAIILATGCIEDTQQYTPENTYSDVVVEMQTSYEYSRMENLPIMMDCNFDITNVGNAPAKNVQVEYSILIDGRELETGVLYVGDVHAGQYINRQKKECIELTDREWKLFINDMTDFELEFDEIRSD